MFTVDIFWGSLGTSIFGSSSSATNNTRSRLPSTLPFLSLMTMEKLTLHSELIKKTLLLFTDEACKLKESAIIDETEAEIETEALLLWYPQYEVSTIPDTQVIMTPQLLDSPKTHKIVDNMNN